MTSEGGPAGRGPSGWRWACRVAAEALPLLVLPAILGAMAAAGCGANHTSLSVTLGTVDPSTTVAANQTIEFVITVIDTGTAARPGSPSPPTCRRTSATRIPGPGRQRGANLAGRRQGQSHQPAWGVWELSGYKDDVTIDFDALALGSPIPTHDGERLRVDGVDHSEQPTAHQADRCPPALGAGHGQPQPGGARREDVTYRVSVINQGTGPGQRRQRCW